MIDWTILNYLNKQKHKSILLIHKNPDTINKFIKNNLITIIDEKNLIDHFPKNAYHIISTWDALSYGSSLTIYTYLSKLNHMLRDDGEIFLRVIKAQSHLKDFTQLPFCWNIERINSIGKAKGLKLKDSIANVTTKEISFIRFKYVPDF